MRSTEFRRPGLFERHQEPSYNTWNIGVGFTYKVFTLDLRYSDTNLSKANCNAFTSDYSTTNSQCGFRDGDQPRANASTAFGSNWCGSGHRHQASAT